MLKLVTNSVEQRCEARFWIESLNLFSLVEGAWEAWRKALVSKDEDEEAEDAGEEEMTGVAIFKGRCKLWEGELGVGEPDNGGAGYEDM